MGISQQATIEAEKGLPFAPHAEALDQASLIALMGSSKASESPLEQIKGVKVPALEVDKLPVTKRMDGRSVERLGSLLAMMPEAVEVFKKAADYHWVSPDDLRSLMEEEEGLEAAESAAKLLEKANSGLLDDLQGISDQLVVDMERRFRGIVQPQYRHRIQDWYVNDASDGVMPVVADRKLMDEVRFDGVGLTVVEPPMACVVDIELQVLVNELSPLSVLAYDLLEKLSVFSEVASLGDTLEFSLGYGFDFSELVRDRKLLHFLHRGTKKYGDKERWWRRVGLVLEKRCPDLVLDLFGDDVELQGQLSPALDFLLLDGEHFAYIQEGRLPGVDWSQPNDLENWLGTVNKAINEWEGSDKLRGLLKVVVDSLADYGLVQASNDLETWSDYGFTRMAVVDGQWLDSGLVDHFGEMVASEGQESFSRINLDNPIEPLIKRAASRLLMGHFCVSV